MWSRLVRSVAAPSPRRLLLLAVFTAMDILFADIGYGAEPDDRLSPFAAEVPARILAGESPPGIASHSIRNIVMLDWLEPHRWGITEKIVTTGHRAQLRQAPFPDRYRTAALAGLSIIES